MSRKRKNLFVRIIVRILKIFSGFMGNSSKKDREVPDDHYPLY